MFEFHNSYIGSGAFGYTTFWVYNTQILPNSSGALSQNYGWTLMYIDPNMLALYGVPAIQCKATISHELGHGMGLSHQNLRPASIMCQAGYGRTASRADATDCFAINHLYN